MSQIWGFPALST